MTRSVFALGLIAGVLISVNIFRYGPDAVRWLDEAVNGSYTSYTSSALINPNFGQGTYPSYPSMENRGGGVDDDYQFDDPQGYSAPQRQHQEEIPPNFPGVYKIQI